MKVDVLFGVPDKLPRGTLVVVDVLRSSSAIVAAIGNGADAVVPFSNLRKAVAYSRALRRQGVLLVGERNGIKPKGFDYNISPFDMSRQNVQGKTIVYSSTNLTRVLEGLGVRNGTLIGSLNNARAVATYLARGQRDVSVVACGDRKGPTIEDVAGAGAIVSHFSAKSLSDQALFAAGLYGNHQWRSLAKRGRIARQILRMGLKKDLEFCLSPDRSSILPGVRSNRIVKLNT